MLRDFVLGDNICVRLQFGTEMKKKTHWTTVTMFPPSDSLYHLATLLDRHTSALNNTASLHILSISPVWIEIDLNQQVSIRLQVRSQPTGNKRDFSTLSLPSQAVNPRYFIKASLIPKIWRSCYPCTGLVLK